jgi:hypothetical protein
VQREREAHKTEGIIRDHPVKRVRDFSSVIPLLRSGVNLNPHTQHVGMRPKLRRDLFQLFVCLKWITKLKPPESSLQVS